MTLPPRRFWLGASLLAGVLSLGLACVLPLVSGRAEAPAALRASSLEAVEQTRAGAEAVWAPEVLAEAEASLRQGLLDWGRQESRPWPLRDHIDTGRWLWRAQTSAWAAQRLTRERLAEARFAADEALAEARRLHDHADALVSQTILPHAERVHLQRARLLLGEAGILLQQGDFVAARERAERSRSELSRALGPALAAARRYTSSEHLERWRRWVEQTRAWSRDTGRTAVLVFKEQNRLLLLRRGEVQRAYVADMGSNAIGRKLRRGDRATPEGRYRVVAKKDRGQSRYHRALLLDYPNEADRRRFAEALAAGEVPPGGAPGGLIEIHGEGGNGRNWTDGCVALSNEDIDELFARVEPGAWVAIVGGVGRDGAFSTLLARLETAGAKGWP